MGDRAQIWPFDEHLSSSPLVVVRRMNLRPNDWQRSLDPPQTLHAPAKVNLTLDVLDRTADGYHDLATLMVPIRMFDSLSFQSIPNTGGALGPIEFSLRGCSIEADVPSDASNLVVRALELLHERSGCKLGARVELVKRIPSGAGLGGGSSNAATALRIANRGWGIDWTTEQLAPLAAELGSDVPFFLERGAAICRGRGERVERLPALVPVNLVIVKPPVALSTAVVYRRFDELSVMGGGAQRGDWALVALVGAMLRGQVERLGQWMGNGLQAAAASLSSWIERVAAAFAGLGFAAHQLTGSGSAYFGICRHAGEARRLASILKTRGLGMVFVTRSCT